MKSKSEKSKVYEVLDDLKVSEYNKNFHEKSEFNKICFEIEQMNPDENIESIAKEIVNERINPQIRVILVSQMKKRQ